ncbi:hypothetical protein [Streptomyces botrytidirepellens]|uniref:hypothetical protein n=1 Tax=Streptomyces botrytidirepellens TaxID=2486417 RepID=UPI0011CD8317|nr:hypothetical protein [Streptomyces botrytidirepellens]
MRLHLANAGRDDINGSDFEGARPIKVDITVPILGFLDASSTPPSGTAPPASYQGTVLEVGPGLIAKKQTVTYVLLTDEKPKLAMRHELRSTDVKKGTPSVPWDREKVNLYRRVTYVTMFLFLANIIITFLSYILVPG